MVKHGHKTRVLSTKVTLEIERILSDDVITKKLTKSGLLSMLIYSYVRSIDGTHRLDPALQKAVDFFEGALGWEYQSSIASSRDKEVTKAVYVYGERNFELYFFKELEKRGEFIVMVDAGSYPMEATYNVKKIFQVFIDDCFPKLARDLKRLCESSCHTTYIDMMKELVDNAMLQDADNAFIESMFADNDRADNARPVTAVKYVAHNHKDPYTDEGRGADDRRDINYE